MAGIVNAPFTVVYVPHAGSDADPRSNATCRAPADTYSPLTANAITCPPSATCPAPGSIYWPPATALPSESMLG